MRNGKVFFSKSKAMAYAAKAIEMGEEGVKVTSFYDAFNQTKYRVSWY